MPRQFTHISRSVNMEWGFKENRVAVIALHKCRKSQHTVFLETPHHVNTARDVSKLPWHKYLKGQ